MEGEDIRPPNNMTTTLNQVATTSITTLKAPSATMLMLLVLVTIMTKHTMKQQLNPQPITTNIISTCQRKGQEELVTLATQASMIKVDAMETTVCKIQTAHLDAVIIMFATVQDPVLSNGSGGLSLCLPAFASL